MLAETSVQSPNENETRALLGKLASRRDRGVRPEEALEYAAHLRRLVESKPAGTFAHLLPAVLNLNGKPYTLNDHFPFEPIFRTELPRQILLKTARQVGKTQSASAKGVILPNIIPNFNILFITPLYEQIRRFSSNYVRPFIEDSPLRGLWTSTTAQNNVLQRSFANNSKMFFSFAYLSSTRVRGIPADACFLDEVQSIAIDHVPIIRETMSASRWRLTMMAGTPLTLDNTIHMEWEASSQAEWFVPCGCGKVNIPSIDHDLDRMIGPYRDDISEERPGVVCAKCGRPIRPREGRWVHRRPELMHAYPGYHIPQILMPIHYAYPAHWGQLLAKQRGGGLTTTAQYYNEVLGESYDRSTKLVSLTELKAAACLPWANDPEHPQEAIRRRRNYSLVVLAVDWGGGGEKRISFTSMAVLGLCPDGRIDVIYGRRLLTPHDPVAEARAVLRVFKAFDCNLLAHDYTGAGALREAWVVQSGIPLERVVPVAYVAAARQNIMVHKPATDTHPRAYYQLDKTRSLVTVCTCIRLGQVRFFRFDFKGAEDRGLIYDLLSLVEEKVESRAVSDMYLITRDPALPDDFAQAVNIGCATIWHTSGRWPNLPEIARYSIPNNAFDALFPEAPWTESDAGLGF